ncbi:transposase domain-containing protein [Methylosinus sp. PW1]|nr:transposase domain-containing protein [Methylosinus sp. PW1]
MNSVDPYAWMKATLEAIADDHPQSRIDELIIMRSSDHG